MWVTASFVGADDQTSSNSLAIDSARPVPTSTPGGGGGGGGGGSDGICDSTVPDDPDCL